MVYIFQYSPTMSEDELKRREITIRHARYYAILRCVKSVRMTPHNNRIKVFNGQLNLYESE